MCNKAVKLDTCLFYRVLGKFLTVEMCQCAVKDDYWFIKNVSDWLRMVEMWTGTIEKEPSMLYYVLVCLKTQEMCNEAVRREPYTLGFVPDNLKTEKTCEKAVDKDSWSLKYVPDWFVTHQKILQVMKLTIGKRCMFPHNDDNLCSGTKVVKNARLKKQRLRKNSCLLLGIHQDGGIGVCQRRRKTRNRKSMEVTDSCF